MTDGGDSRQTDGDLPVLDVRALPVEAQPVPRAAAGAAARPAQIVFGAGVTFVRAVFATLIAVVVLADPTTIAAVSANPSEPLGRATGWHGSISRRDPH